MNYNRKLFILVVAWITMLVILYVFGVIVPKTHAYNADFESRATSFVEKYNPNFSWQYGYLLMVAHEYELRDYDIAVLTALAKYETMFGKTGSGKWYNVAGIKLGRFARYKNWFSGVDAFVLLYVRRYRDLPYREVQRKWVGRYNARYVRDMKRTLSILNPSL